jgi:hypothetical protein
MIPSIDDWDAMSHSSEVTSGTWSFDIQFNLTQVNPGPIANVNFMSYDLLEMNDEDEFNGYYINFFSAEGNDIIFFFESGLMVLGLQSLVMRSLYLLPVASHRCDQDSDWCIRGIPQRVTNHAGRGHRHRHI